MLLFIIDNQRQFDLLRYHLKIKLRRYRFKLICSFVFFVIILFYIFGVFTHLLELKYEDNFVYPYHSPNFRYLIETVKSNLHSAELQPLNNFTFEYHYSPDIKCAPKKVFPPDPITLLIVVKSAACNYQLRAAIRQTWGFEKRFSDVNIRTVFMLGRCVPAKSDYELAQQCDIVSPPSVLSTRYLSWLPSNGSNRWNLDCQQMIDAEYRANQDLVQANFVDSYYNNTLKTLATLHWTVKHCSEVPFMLFVDDDYYISVKNLLKSTRHFLSKANHEVDEQGNDQPDQSLPSQMSSTQFDGRLYMGYVFPYSRPMRHFTSKWYISLAEYPYSRYPPYITGGCFLLNNRTVTDLYYASLYTKAFSFDDVYLGILAKKMSINLVHNPNIHFHKCSYSPEQYKNVISSHGFSDPSEMIRVWTEQKMLGHA